MKPYLEESELTDDIKGAYTKKGNRYELKRLSEDHPVLVHNNTLIQEKEDVEKEVRTLTAKNKNLERERDQLKQSIPEGKVFVDPEIETLGNGFKQLGLKPADVETLKTELDAYKAFGAVDDIKSKIEGYDGAIETAKRVDKDSALLAAGIDPNNARKFVAYNDLEIEREEKDGKVIFNRILRDEKDKEVRAVFNAEYLKTADDLKDVFAVEQPKTKMFKQATGAGTANKYDAIREQVKASNKSTGASFEDKINRRQPADT